MLATTRAEIEEIGSNTTVEIYWLRVAYIPLIDSVISNLKYKFSYSIVPV